jgi:hypothetical protein
MRRNSGGRLSCGIWYSVKGALPSRGMSAQVLSSSLILYFISPSIYAHACRPGVAGCAMQWFVQAPAGHHLIRQTHGRWRGRFRRIFTLIKPVPDSKTRRPFKTIRQTILRFDDRPMVTSGIHWLWRIYLITSSSHRLFSCHFGQGPFNSIITKHHGLALLFLAVLYTKHHKVYALICALGMNGDPPAQDYTQHCCAPKRSKS